MWAGTTMVLPMVILVTRRRRRRRRGAKNERFPPGPWGWPIVGHLHLIRNLPHQALRDVSTKYGPIVGLRLGQRRAVAISSPALAKEVLLTHDKIFANRPLHEFTSLLRFGTAEDIIFSHHGPPWRKHRKICTVSLFNAKRLQELEYVRQEEMALLLQRIQDASLSGTEPVDISRCVGEMSSRLVMRLVQSKASLYAGDGSMQELVKEFEQAVSTPTIGDLIPCLSWLDFSKKQQMRRLHDRANKVLTTILAERKLSTSHHDDLLEDLLSKVGHNISSPLEDTFTIDDIKTIMMDMFAAGIHTTALTLEWAMAELLKNPHCLHRLQTEIDTMLGKKKQILDADIPKLSFLKCLIKEVLRLHPAVPLLVPRVSTEECKVQGYTLPANTYMFVNVWAIGRDEQVWPNANQFLPERFEGKDMDLKGQQFELLPFGSGRRICLGLPLALSIVDVTIANLVNSFDWETHAYVNMDEKNGITSNKATPTIAIPKLRVSIS